MENEVNLYLIIHQENYVESIKNNPSSILQNKPVILHFVSGEQFSSAAWSLTQPHVVFFSTEKGNIQVWDITKRRSEPFQSQNVAGSPINGNNLVYKLVTSYDDIIYYYNSTPINNLYS